MAKPGPGPGPDPEALAREIVAARKELIRSILANEPEAPTGLDEWNALEIKTVTALLRRQALLERAAGAEACAERFTRTSGMPSIAENTCRALAAGWRQEAGDA